MGKYSKHRQLKTLKRLPSDADPSQQRKAILKVFQKHQDTLAHSSTSDRRKDSDRKRRREAKNHTTGIAVDIAETNKMDTRAVQKTRHRRTRGRSKSVDHSQRKVDRQEKAEFKKKTRALNDATERAKMERSALKDVNHGNNAALITRSRLTQKIGIFNKGKRSEAIHRQGIHISKETHAKAEEDMRKILDLSDAELSKPVRLQDLEYSPPGQNLHQNIVQSPDLSLEPLYTPVIKQVKTSTPASVITSSAMEIEPITPASPPKPSTTLPEKPSFSKISTNLLESLKPEKIFIGRKYFNEVQQELCQLMRKQHSFLVQAEKEKRKTPVSVEVTSKHQTLEERPEISSNDIAIKPHTPYESQDKVAPMEVDAMQPDSQEAHYINHRQQGDEFYLANQQETLQVSVEPGQPSSVPASPVFFPSWHTYADLHPQVPHPQLCVEPGYVEQGYRSMDIIDYLDYQLPRGNTLINYQQGNGVVVRPHGGLLHHRFRSEYKGQGVTSGGSDSPSWRPPHHQLPWKPVEDMPSPRLYPMKLY
ncbi:uncharacterized protein LOC118421320 isoform X1 [Branchiostoma floridae]|uniref:Uncharacterized protein LOC118421320 isoform X1 n=2 Tax=Branchiostoma floridae TaxID=7739 RepID=A0A9J7LMI3_BRAFL|nr:uncharacterized protein LOC118421320 isoform X1 [Branchiostoma floridae]